MKLSAFTLLFVVTLAVACATPAMPTVAPTPSSSPSPVPSLTPSPQATATALATATSSRMPSPTATSKLPPTMPPRPTVPPTATRIPIPPTAVRAITLVPGAQCPFNIPVKASAPGLYAGSYQWPPVITPNGDACVSQIAVARNDARTWFAGAQNGLYITRDNGTSWERPLPGQVSAIEFDPNDPNRVYVAFQVDKSVYGSSDQGRNWRMLKKFDQAVMSLHASADGSIMAGVNWTTSPTPNGIYISHDQGATWENSPFGTPQRGLLAWVIAQDPRDQTLYVGNEIYDHPKPYKPPIFRSRDRGKTWQDITGILTWHVVAMQVSPQNGYVYAVTEGAGVYGSSNQGDQWVRLGTGPSVSLILDPNHPGRLFGGGQYIRDDALDGGVSASNNNGKSFLPIGLRGITVGSLALSPDGSTLFAAAYASGIYRVALPK